MSHLVDAIAANLRRLREQSGFSLSRLASLSGVGKTTLSQIELGNGNPTIGTLEALAGVLGVDAAELLAPAGPASRLMVVRRGEGTGVGSGGAGGNLVHARGAGSLTLEFHRLELEPGARDASASHGSGAHEHVCVARGRIGVAVDGREEVLEAGDYASFPSDRVHVWRNAGEEPAEFWVAVTLPRHE
ncbi:helix-turn-helix domain-containing protein [Leucobacter celer]|uniref:helix-turn-helix domain-containing protein n=1 Tax=Leucobacter celer TaxID=668625 RepID=UPI0006A78755|nr:XRE family transcriptional regulator [Leucobacter celer]